jgi:hypothetical protein
LQQISDQPILEDAPTNTRRNLLAAAAFIASTAPLRTALAQGAKEADFLFVQNAKSMTYDKASGRLTLVGISPVTIFFTDRPERIAGHHLTAEYLQFWKAGPDSFLKDPPNATLSVFEKGKDELSDVVVTLRNPRLSGGDLTYDITVISGAMPKTSGPASLFIDIIGLPFTPLSFAGVARRTAYRTVVWGGAAAAATTAAERPPAPAPVYYTAPARAAEAAPAAPAVNPAQAAAVAKLKELKSLQTQGLISEAQYQAESQKLLSQIVQ